MNQTQTHISKSQHPKSKANLPKGIASKTPGVSGPTSFHDNTSNQKQSKLKKSPPKHVASAQPSSPTKANFSPKNIKLN